MRAGKLALAGIPILIKVPPPEVRHGLSGPGDLYASTHRSRSLDALYFEYRRSGSPNRTIIVRRQAVFGPRLRRRLQDAKVESRYGRFAMRKTRCLAFGQCRQQHERALVGLILASGLAFAGSGCHQHYHYYNSTDPCAPGTPVSSTVRSGSICDPQTSLVEGGTTVADGSARSTTVSGAQSKSPRVVVSNPDSSSRFSWRRSDSDGLAQTSVQGSLDDGKVNR